MSLLFFASCGNNNGLKDSSSDTNSIHLSKEAREIRENNLNEYYTDTNYKIHSEVIIEDKIISGATCSDETGLYLFETGQDYAYANVYSESNGKKILKWMYMEETAFYLVFWVTDSNITSVEVNYFVEEKKVETLTFDTKEIFYLKLPSKDCVCSVDFLDKKGNAFQEESFEYEHINYRVLLDTTMYWKTENACEPVSEELISGKITSYALPYAIPTESGQANFGQNHPYKIEDDYLKVSMYGQWYIFEKLWEVKMTASDVTKEGLTLTCSHKGKGFATNFHMNDSYWLELKTEEGWKEVPMIAEVQWRGESYFIEENKTVELKINWDGLYREMKPGEYRIGKLMHWFEERHEEYVTQNCYAEFTIK